MAAWNEYVPMARPDGDALYPHGVDRTDRVDVKLRLGGAGLTDTVACDVPWADVREWRYTPGFKAGGVGAPLRVAPPVSMEIASLEAKLSDAMAALTLADLMASPKVAAIANAWLTLQARKAR